MSQHIVPTRVYYLVFGALMCLTLLTYSIAFVNLGSFNLVVAIGIAILKASLVILFFMHVKYSTTLTKAVVATGFIFFGVMIFFTMADLISRGWSGVPGR